MDSNVLSIYGLPYAAAISLCRSSVHPLPTVGSAIRPRFYYGDPIPLHLLVAVAITVVDSINSAVGVLEALELTNWLFQLIHNVQSCLLTNQS
jgi:hypothetical protein